MRLGTMTKLNISRILIFAFVLLVLRTAVGFLVAGFPARDEVDTQLILQYLVGYVLDAVVVTAVFVRLAYVQTRAPYMHAFSVIVLQELLSTALLFVIGETNSTSPLWLIDWVVLVVSAVLGVELGRRLRDRSSNRV